MDSIRTRHIPNETEMLAFGATIGRALCSGDCLAFYGTLGAGKTTLIRGLLQGLLGTGCDVPSPTFTLVQTYEMTPPLPLIWHFDLYRLEDPQEVFELGWETALEDIALIEWPENAGDHLPQWSLDIDLDYDENGGRNINFRGEGWKITRFLHLFDSV